MKNPFTKSSVYRYKIAWDLVPANSQTVLDYGAGNGDFLSGLKHKNKKINLIALEIDKNKKKVISKLKYINVAKIHKNKILLKNNAVDVVTMLDVLEHVPDEKVVLNEVWRILKPGGKLVLTVPNKGLTEILDPGNIKFRYPKLHKFLYKHILKKDDYVEKFCCGKLCGDVSLQKRMWHRHYKLQQLKKLFGNRFEIVYVTYYGMFHTVISAINEVSRVIYRKDQTFLKRLYMYDTRKNFGKLSYSLMVEAVKKVIKET